MEAFCDILNSYIESLNVTAARLAEASGISTATLSRYRAGARLPLKGSQAVSDLAGGIYSLALTRGMELSREDISGRLNAALPGNEAVYPGFSARLDTLIEALGINVRRLSAHLKVDPSYISRIRRGLRTPGDSAEMISGIASYLLKNPQKDHVFINLSHLLGHEVNPSSEDLPHRLLAWFGEKKTSSPDIFDDFLRELNDFDMVKLQKRLHYDDIRIPAIPFTLPGTKTYRGSEGLKQGELDFFRMCATSRSNAPVFLYSDLSDEDSFDAEFSRKRLYGLFACIKRGLRINVIHPLPQDATALLDTMIKWLPLYMSGQVFPYYVPKVSSLFSHLYYCAGPALLSGECPGGDREFARLSLSPKKEDIALGRLSSESLLNGATPLMEIYRKNNFEDFNEFLGRNLALFPDLTLSEYDSKEYENLRIRTLPGKLVIITKLKSPQARIVISHPAFLDAFSFL